MRFYTRKRRCRHMTLARQVAAQPSSRRAIASGGTRSWTRRTTYEGWQSLEKAAHRRARAPVLYRHSGPPLHDGLGRPAGVHVQDILVRQEDLNTLGAALHGKPLAVQNKTVNQLKWGNQDSPTHGETSSISNPRAQLRSAWDIEREQQNFRGTPGF